MSFRCLARTRKSQSKPNKYTFNTISALLSISRKMCSSLHYNFVAVYAIVTFICNNLIARTNISALH